MFPMKTNGKRLEVNFPKERAKRQVLIDGEPFPCRALTLHASVSDGVTAAVEYYPGEVDLTAEVERIDFKALKVDELTFKRQAAPNRLKHACYAFVEGFLHPREFIPLAEALIPIVQGLLDSTFEDDKKDAAEMLASTHNLLRVAREQAFGLNTL